MTTRLNHKLAELAAAVPTHQGDVTLMARVFDTKLRELFARATSTAKGFTSLHPGFPSNGEETALANITLQEVYAIVRFFKEQTTKRIQEDVVSENCRFGVEVQFTDPRSPMLELSLALREEPVRALRINGTLYTSGLPFQAGVDIETDIAVQIKNTPAGSIVGIGVTLRPVGLRLRAGLSSLAWERLARIGADSKDSGSTMGRQYQVHFIGAVNTWSLGLETSSAGFDYPDDCLPEQGGLMSVAHTGWTTVSTDGGL